MFSNGNSTPATFASINTKEGAFVVSAKKPEGGYEKTSFTQMRDVRLTHIKMEDDEYEGTPVRKVRMTFEDQNGRAIVDINAATYAAAVLVGRLNKTNLSASLGLSVQQQKAGSTYKRKDGTMSEPLTSDITTVSVYQGDGYVRLADNENPPKTEMVKVGSKEVANTEERDKYIEATVVAIAEKLAGSNTSPATQEPVTTGGGGFGSDDIPFAETPFGKRHITWL